MPDDSLGEPHVTAAPRRSRGPFRAALIVATLVALVVLAGAAAASTGLTLADAGLLGVIEGLTEYVPVSSTGHLTVAERLLDIGTTSADKDAADAYAVCIQAGAIVAVAIVYRERLVRMARGAVGQDAGGRRLLTVLMVAFVPAAILGAGFGEAIQDRLFGVGPIVAAWAVGGLYLVLAARRVTGGSRALEAMTARDGLLIGLAQALALWPGVSRSLVTIVAALLLGLNAVAAVEFSFLLGLLTLGAATVFEGATDGSLVLDEFGIAAAATGLLAALASAVVAVRWLTAFLAQRDLTAFGWYRLGVAAAAGALLVTGHL